MSKALVELRRRLGQTQESLARCLGVSLQTVALWETKRPPGGFALLRLCKLAKEDPDLLKIFADAVERGNRRTVQRMREDEACWNGLYTLLESIRQDPAAGERIQQLARAAQESVNEVQDRSWRNQR